MSVNNSVYGRGIRGIQTMAASATSSRRLYMINSGIVHSKFNSRQEIKPWLCHLRERYSRRLSVLDLNHNDVRVLSRGIFSAWFGSEAAQKRTSLNILIAFTDPCLVFPRASHHLTRLPIYTICHNPEMREKYSSWSSPEVDGS